MLVLGINSGSARDRTLWAAACMVVGLLATLSRVVLAIVLAGRGWWFAGEKLALALPLALIGAGCAAALGIPFLVSAWRRRDVDRRRPVAAAALFVAGYCSTAGLLVTFAVGYPMPIGGAVAVVALVAGVSALTWLGLTRRGSRGVRVTLVLVGVVPLLATAGLAFYRNLQPVLVGANAAGHGHLAASASAGGGATATDPAAISVAELRTPRDAPGPARDFTLMAREEVATLPSGAVVDAWTFGSLPGPELRVRQGDLVEVTAGEPGHRGRRDAALARVPGAERRGRRGGSHAGRGGAGGVVQLPVRGLGGRDVLVSRPSGVVRGGAPWALRHVHRGTCRAIGGRRPGGPRPHLRRCGDTGRHGRHPRQPRRCGGSGFASG